MNKLIEDIRNESIRFHSKQDLQAIIDEIGDRKVVLLGEASHGTSEFYTIRAELTKMLIKQKGFNVIGVEGDWPSCFQVNRFIKGYDQDYRSSRDVLHQEFNRWPTWMWANEEIRELVDWLKEFNFHQQKKVGFYGIDVYSLWESMEEVVKYLKKIKSEDVEIAKKAFGCFEPFNKKPETYRISASFLSDDCINEVTELLKRVQMNRHQYPHTEEVDLNVEINSLVAANAERYYRAMVKDDTESWNIRDYHMSDTIDKLLSYSGDETKIIIWEHNTHIGDARYTDMKDEGLVNVGQITRERYGENQVYAVGFGTHRGTVMASRRWGYHPEVMQVPNGEKYSWEDCMHIAAPYNQLLLFNDKNRNLFDQTIGHRAIGVVYQPEYEHLGNYVPTSMSNRYDAFVFVDQSRAVEPLKVEVPI